ncbi:MAG: ParB/RepB/Spo0J family partition protein [Patescibacteria group bacterium]|nr:ParB/RepB/Spo0J family partition protein [Patescibacteria group bacterium]
MRSREESPKLKQWARMSGGAPTIMSLPLIMIDAGELFRTRLRFADIEALAADIRENGQLSPMLVRPRADRKYDLIAGFRRYAALQKLREATGLVRIYENITNSDAFCLAVAENVQRDDLTPLEKALICEKLHLGGISKPKIAKLVFPSMDDPEGRTVANYLTIVKTELPIREALSQGRIGFSHALALADAVKSERARDYFRKNPTAIGRMINRIAIDDLSVREIKAGLADLLRDRPHRGRPAGSASSSSRPSRSATAPSAPRSAHPTSRLFWRDNSPEKWRLEVNFDGRALRHDPESLEEIEEKLKEALERVRKFREKNSS